MTAICQLIDCYRADSKLVKVTITVPDGTAWDPSIPGIDLEFRVATSANAFAKNLISKRLGDGITLTPTGAEILLSAADTDLRPGSYFVELKIFDLPGGNDACTVSVGVLKIRPSLRMRWLAQPTTAQAGLRAGAPTVA